MNAESVHPGDVLSAYADGELTEPERAAVDAHLATCPPCRHELEATQHAKAWITALPAVEPPFGFLERMLLDPSAGRRRREGWASRAAAVGLAGAAAVWLAVVGLSGLTGNRPGGLPALNSLVSLHEETAPPEDTPVDEMEELRTEQEAASLGLPPSMGPFHLLSVTEPMIDAGQPQQATYGDGDELLSAFVYVGYDILEGRLPAGSRELLLASGRGWLVPADPSPVVLVQAGSNAVVLVGPEPAPSMADGLESPRPEPSLMDQIQGAGEGLLEAFGLG